jgi:hypothetical protein
MSCINWGWEPQNQNDLIVRDKYNIEDFDDTPMIIFTNVLPTIVLSSFFVSSLSIEVVCQSYSPKSSQTEHNDLASWDRYSCTSFLVVKEMSSVDDGK